MEERVLTARFGRLNNPAAVDEYLQLAGYAGLKKALKMSGPAILDELDEALLLGRGGASYPLGKKWRHLYQAAGPDKYIVCNADEGEPGTYKDKALLEQDPLAVIEGMTIAGRLFDARQGYIYIRGEYRQVHEIFQRALKNARKAHLLGRDIMGIAGFDYDIKIISGAGAYVCGENSALLNSIEGKTGRPRVKPPHLADVGLYGKPTLVNNVESFAGIPVILREGGRFYRQLGTEGGGGTKLVCLTGHIKQRGLYEIKLGTPLQELIYSETFGGGSSTGRPLKFAHFGGQSGMIGDLSQLENCLYSYEDLWDHGVSVGCGAIVVLDDSVNLVDYLTSVAAFFAHESCGKCTPCRIGTLRQLELMEKIQKGQATAYDLEVLTAMIGQITALSACGLGQSAGNAIASGLACFPQDFQEKMTVAADQRKVEVSWL